MPDKIVGQNENVVNDKKIVDVLKKLVQFIEEEKDFYLLIRDEFSYLLFSAPFLQWPELFNRVRSEVRNLGVNISEIRSRTNENYKELAKCFVGKKIYRADADSGTLNLEEAARYLVNKDGGEIHEALVEVIRSVIGLGETSVTVAFKRIETLKRQEKEAVQKFLEFYRDLMRRDEKDRIQPYILLEEPPQELDVMLEQQFLDGIKELDNDLRSPKSQHLPELRQTKYGSSLGESGFKLLWQNKFSPGYVVKVLADQQRRSRLPTYESEFKELRVDVGGRQRKVHEWNISVVVRTPQDKNFTFRANVIVYD